MFWFIYQDLGNLDKPWFMHALGLITVAFAFFWLLIPIMVVWCRIRRRCAQNKARYQKWRAEGGIVNLRPGPVKNIRLVAVDSEEQVFFHEKGTLYIQVIAQPVRAHSPSAPSAPQRPVGRPSDVAFPKMRRDFHVCQRTHCYVTNHRIVFEGKDLDISVPFGELRKFSVSPGGIVFEVCDSTFLFTFQNPLVVADILRYARMALKNKDEAL